MAERMSAVEHEALMGLLRQLVKRMPEMSDEQRKAMIDTVTGEWCQWCGRSTGQYGCHCTNDE